MSSTQPAATDTAKSFVISPVSEIVAELRAGHMVILVDEEDRENEGDLVVAADFITPDAINFLVPPARGLGCLTLTHERCEQIKPSGKASWRERGWLYVYISGVTIT